MAKPLKSTSGLEAVKAGQVYYAQVCDQTAAMWIVLVVTPELLPEFVKQKDNNPNYVPCWVIGEFEFLWVDRDELYALDPSHKQHFIGDDRQHFSMLFDLVISVGSHETLDLFKSAIIDAANEVDVRHKRGEPLKRKSQQENIANTAKRRQEGSQSSEVQDENQNATYPQSNSNWMFFQDGTEEPFEDVAHAAGSVFDHLGAKSRRSFDTDVGNTATFTSNSGTPTRIKEEAKDEDNPDYSKAIEDGAGVKNFVGKHNKTVTIRRDDLLKSAVLTSYITDDIFEGSYIMRPQLIFADLNHFDAVCQVLHCGDYKPKIIESPGAPVKDTKTLEGVRSTEDYSKELVRAGHLYIMAQSFKVKGMTEKILEKITQAMDGKYSLKSLIDFSTIIFSDDHITKQVEQLQEPKNLSSAGPEGWMQPLQLWTISTLANRLPDIICSEPFAFLQLESKTRKSQLWAEVMLKSANDYRAFGLPKSTIELDG